MSDINDELITEDWLKTVGFKWHQLDRQPEKQWVLWLGRATASRAGDVEDIGIEVAPMGHGEGWFCWLRDDCAGRYHRFIHVRYMYKRADLIRLIEAITGQPWNPLNHFYGSVLTPEAAARERQERDRLDRKLQRDGYPWSEIEKDDTMGRALPEHREAYEKARAAK